MSLAENSLFTWVVGTVFTGRLQDVCVPESDSAHLICGYRGGRPSLGVANTFIA